MYSTSFCFVGALVVDVVVDMLWLANRFVWLDILSIENRQWLHSHYNFTVCTECISIRYVYVYKSVCI